MDPLGLIAIEETVVKKETLLILVPMEQGILVKTLFYQQEIAPQLFDIAQPKTNKFELDMAK